MTNKARQRSLMRKNGLSGKVDYCVFCSGRVQKKADGEFTYVCQYPITAEPSTFCAIAYNRMIRKRQIDEGKR